MSIKFQGLNTTLKSTQSFEFSCVPTNSRLENLNDFYLTFDSIYFIANEPETPFKNTPFALDMISKLFIKLDPDLFSNKAIKLLKVCSNTNYLWCLVLNQDELELLQYASFNLANRFKLNQHEEFQDLELIATDINVYLFRNDQSGLSCVFELKNRDEIGKDLREQEFKLNENAVSSLDLNKALTNERIKQFSAGKEHVLMLGSQSGRVYSFGIGTKGQLGHSKIENCFEVLPIFDLKAKIESISTGGSGWHSAAIDIDGNCYVWGWNSHGQLGILDDESAFVPKPTRLSVVNELDGLEVRFKKVSLGSKHSVLVDLSGDVYSFGWNKYKQLYEPDEGEEVINQIDEPLRLNEFKVKDVKCGCWFTLTLSD